jgi:hypothetical protein
MGYRFDETDLSLLEIREDTSDDVRGLIEELRNARDEAAAWETKAADVEEENRHSLAECFDKADDAQIHLKALRRYLKDAPIEADQLADDIAECLRDIKRACP